MLGNILVGGRVGGGGGIWFIKMRNKIIYEKCKYKKICFIFFEKVMVI